MKYTIFYGKISKSGVGDIVTEYDTFNTLQDAKDVLENIEDYLTESERSYWGDVQKGDYLEFHLYAVGETEEEKEKLDKTDSFLGCNSYTGTIYSSFYGSCFTNK